MAIYQLRLVLDTFGGENSETFENVCGIFDCDFAEAEIGGVTWSPTYSALNVATSVTVGALHQYESYFKVAANLPAEFEFAPATYGLVFWDERSFDGEAFLTMLQEHSANGVSLGTPTTDVATLRYTVPFTVNAPEPPAPPAP